MRQGRLYLDRAGDTDARLLEDVRGRVASHMALSPDQVLLAPTPGAFALIGLEPNLAVTIGRVGSPVAMMQRDAVTSDQRRVELALSDDALMAALSALNPVADAERQADDTQRYQALGEIANILKTWPDVGTMSVNGRFMDITLNDADSFDRRCNAAGLVLARPSGNVRRAICPDAKTAHAFLSRLAFDTRRNAVIRRTTKETDILVALDLDGAPGGEITTGIAFFDHMLEQIARHGGFALAVTATGDIEVDAHHTIEDVCLALGEGLRQALGDKRGIARFGFELPMDETRAGVWIDLSGRPFAKFDGEIPGERVAGFPVEMTSHAFRSLAEAMKASIHVEVTGENAHHMIEACFKTFGRALRQAIHVEGQDLPSTKGVL